jgi:transcriptional regulator with PAS, ATPase and Fis domain
VSFDPETPPASPRAGQGRPGPAMSPADLLKLYEMMFNSIHNGAVVVDAQGYIILFNEPYGRFLGIDPQAQIGRHITEVLEHSRMHIVAQTGVPEINMTMRIKGQNLVVQRIPIFQDGQVVAAFGQVMFKDVGDVRRLAARLKLLEKRVQLFEEGLTSPLRTRYTLEAIKGHSPALQRLRREALKAAASGSPVLLTGESGTGKEMFAQAIHHLSSRSDKPFIRINCSAIPKDLFEAEFFGYEGGAFTGARPQGKPGKFKLAHSGTILLDEIGEIPLEMQPKLLRVLEEREFEPLGGTALLQADFRLITATNQDIERMTAEGRFRKDLYYRLNVIRLHIPPLRDRPEDVIAIAGHLLAQMAEETTAAGYRLTSAAEEVLLHHSWPGNVRELHNVLLRALANLEGETIEADDLRACLRLSQAADQARPKPKRLKEEIDQTEREALERTLVMAGYNKAKTAQLLGIDRTHLYKKLKKYGIALTAPGQAEGR